MIDQPIPLTFEHRIRFTRDAFATENPLLSELLQDSAIPPSGEIKVLPIIDANVAAADATLVDRIKDYLDSEDNPLVLAGKPVIVTGGEAAKNDFTLVESLWLSINNASLDRHSYVLIIGGGAVLDLASFAASTAHRGIRHVRFPTTTLSQGDGGVGVKNGINFFGKKNWIGTFTVPFAVVNDFAFLDLLPERERRAGIIEAIKVALVRDAKFYHEIEDNADALAALESGALERLVEESARQHVEHIATSGDPFELGSARPLDFGHWAAHKLEQVSNFRIGHGEAVAIGLALDLRYSALAGIVDSAIADRIIDLIEKIGFPTFAPELLETGSSDEPIILEGLEEFREHLGGELTITLITEIGTKLEVHEMDRALILEALESLAPKESLNSA